ncbi:hypothetical protein J9345_11850 [Bacillus subtilis subsp. subtilis]|uniref:hypothetical protein n=1 Tax=Bacillus subtilis TaxID=1423 RepID=UPI0018A7C198|nr:hypothetical protein [Bacillus subtilis]MBF8215792.1 hypothetical protein [Bacillus subtilis]MBP3047349.1 hypothetical protein [Bacillus subtilis subsp. subtilis]MED3626766.1 hypothetical protein [Bacillus subtilis]UIS26605.1 hypothetical protein Goe14_01610 [Bacillus phage vB_BsuS-Goe14]
MNQSYKVSLEKLPIESLERLNTDIQNRINDGLRTDNNAYIKDQRRKLQIVLDELVRRSTFVH